MKMNLGLGLGARQQTVGYDTNASAYFAAMATQGTDAYKAWIDTFITKLVNDRLWSKLCAAWLLANKDEDAALINMRNPSGTKASKVLLPTFAAYEGFTAGGTANTCIDTGLTPAQFCFSETDAGFTIYSRTNSAISGYELGCTDGTTAIACNPRNASDLQQSLLNQQAVAADAWDTGTPNSGATHTVIRSTAIANQVRAYRNGTLYNTAAITSRAVQATRNVYLLAYNNNGAILAPSTRQLSLAMFHTGMTPTQVGLLYTHIDWLMANTPAGNKTFEAK